MHHYDSQDEAPRGSEVNTLLMGGMMLLGAGAFMASNPFIKAAGRIAGRGLGLAFRHVGVPAMKAGLGFAGGALVSGTRGAIKTSAGIGNWLLGGKGLMHATLDSHGRHSFALNTRLRNTILGSMAAATAVQTFRMRDTQRIAGYQTDSETLEQRHSNDLNATGSLGLAMRDTHTRHSLLHAGIHSLLG